MNVTDHPDIAHTDTARTDTARTDTGHGDVRHEDVGHGDIGPLMVLGPPRCSQTLVALSVAQHPGCRLVLDTSWLPRLGDAVVGLHRAATRHGDRSALGVVSDPSTFAAAAGAAARHLIMESAFTDPSILGSSRPDVRSTRSAWVTSGTIDRASDAALLLAMFPDGHIVHVLRHPDAVVHSLATTACGDGRYASRADGYRIWHDATTALVDVAHAYGSDRITRIVTSRLQTETDAALTRCLAPLRLELDAACRRPLDGVGADGAAPVGDEPTRRAAVDLYDRLVRADPSHREPGDAAHVARLRHGYHPSTTVSSSAGGDEHDRYRLFVQLATPAGTTVVVISKGDPSLIDVPGRHCSHLPQGSPGAYLGHHPADSAAAVAHVTTAVRDGARYLVIPAASSWWLDHYHGVAEWLATNARMTAHHESIATAYELPTEVPHG